MVPVYPFYQVTSKDGEHTFECLVRIKCRAGKWFLSVLRVHGEDYADTLSRLHTNAYIAINTLDIDAALSTKKSEVMFGFRLDDNQEDESVRIKNIWPNCWCYNAVM
jgi:hypothetical protein